MTGSPNFYTPAECLAAYGRPRTVDGITIHHWGDPAAKPTFDGVVAHLCNPASRVSAHYVVEAGRRAQLVDEGNAAWHAGSAAGNATQVGIECNPLARDEDYAEVAALVAEIRSRRGDLPLHPHKLWVATACPGAWDLSRLDAMARGIVVQPVSNPAPVAPVTTPPVAPAPAPAPVPSRLVVDGDFGPLTKKALQRALGVAADGSVGPITVGALQRHVGASADGSWGPLTTKALQRHLGVAADGVFGPISVRALQTRLNAGTF